MLENLREEVCRANLYLVAHDLVTLTWGNVSAITDDRKYVIIKPSGVPYETMTADQMVIVTLDGTIVEGNLRPSSDLPTHLELYRAFPDVKSVVHTHSRWATTYAQAERDLTCYGTTHADQFYVSVPCTRPLTDQEIETDYETNTGRVIVKTFRERNQDPIATPAVLVNKHGPFTWGTTAQKAVENALVLEEVCRMGLFTQLLQPSVGAAPQFLMDKHFFRKHGANAYYGQEK